MEKCKIKLFWVSTLIIAGLKQKSDPGFLTDSLKKRLQIREKSESNMGKKTMRIY